MFQWCEFAVEWPDLSKISVVQWSYFWDPVHWLYEVNWKLLFAFGDCTNVQPNLVYTLENVMWSQYVTSRHTPSLCWKILITSFVVTLAVIQHFSFYHRGCAKKTSALN